MHKKFLIFILPALLFVGCKKSPHSLADLKDGTPADSMMYYFGQMQADNYWQDAETDTTLRSEEARSEFIKGFRAALDMESSDKAYNKGLELGLRLAIRLREFEHRYGVKFPESVLAASLENALKDDNREKVAVAQQGFYRLKDRFELKAAKKDVEGAKGKLATASQKQGFKMLSDTLFFKDVAPGEAGPKFKDGDRVAVEVTASKLNGEEIVARQFPDSITLGKEARVPGIVMMGIQTMTNGQTRSFMTTPRTLFGKRYAVYNLPADEPVIFTVKAGKNTGVANSNGNTEESNSEE